MTIEKIFDALKNTLPGLIDKKYSKTETENEELKVSCYWAGTVLRIDLKPKK